MFFNRTQDFLHRFVPTGEGTAEFGGMACFGPGFPVPMGAFLDGDEIHQFAAAQIVMNEMPAGPGPDPGSGGHFGPVQPVGCDGAAPGHLAGEARPLRPEQAGTDGGVDAVGPDQQVAFHLLPAMQHGGDAGAEIPIGEDRAVDADPDALAPAFVVQQVMKVGAMDLDIGKAIARLMGAAQAVVEIGEAGQAIADFRCFRLEPPAPHLRQQAQMIDHPCRIGADLDAGPHFRQFRRAFQNLDLKALAGQAKGGAEPAKAGPGNDDALLSGHGGSAAALTRGIEPCRTPAVDALDQPGRDTLPQARPSLVRWARMAAAACSGLGWISNCRSAAVALAIRRGRRR